MIHLSLCMINIVISLFLYTIIISEVNLIVMFTGIQHTHTNKHTLHRIQDFFLKNLDGETESGVNGGISLLKKVPALVS